MQGYDLGTISHAASQLLLGVNIEAYIYWPDHKIPQRMTDRESGMKENGTKHIKYYSKCAHTKFSPVPSLLAINVGPPSEVH